MCCEGGLYGLQDGVGIGVYFGCEDHVDDVFLICFLDDDVDV